MRNAAKLILASLAVLALCSAGAWAQDQGQGQGRGGRGGRGGGRGMQQPGFVASGVPAMPDPVGPAPAHDLTGTWVGPLSVAMGPYATFYPGRRGSIQAE